MAAGPFDAALTSLVDGFRSRSIRAAAIGGFAMALSGAPRNTVDLDFLVHRDDLAALGELMRALGYAARFQSENVSQYAGPGLVPVDFVHAFRPISLGMLSRAREADFAGQGRSVKVLEVEDIIGLKVQAIVNNPARRERDLADIQALAEARDGRLDWDRVEEYFALFGRQADCAALRARFPGA